MPIRDLAPTWRELGRIRIGRQVPRSDGRGTRPDKLQTFRLTSPNRDAINAAAGLYGGRPEEWSSPAGPAWEVVTGSDTLDVVLPPGDVLSQWYELWSGGGAKRRCDGITEQLTGRPCLCPADPNDRAEAAKGERPTACRPITRLRVILPGLPDLGVWRLEAHGRIAAQELAATAAAVEVATRRGAYVPARLRLEQRRTGTPPRAYGIPVLELPAVDAGRLLAGDGQAGETYTHPALLTADAPDPGPDDDEPTGPTFEELAAPSLADEADVERTYGRRVEPASNAATIPILEPPAAAARDTSPGSRRDEQSRQDYIDAHGFPPEDVDPDSPTFLGPEPEWVAERRRAAESQEPPPPSPGSQPLPAAEIGDALSALHELADKHHRTHREAEEFLWTIAVELRPELAGALEDLERVPRAAWDRTRRRFELGDYDLTPQERATRKAREIEERRMTQAEQRLGRSYTAEPDTLNLGGDE